MSTALAIIDKITAVEFFKPGASSPILERVKKEARELAATFDVSTPAGQEGLRKLAAQLGKTKNKIENEGKALVAGEKARLKVIDVERSLVWDEMESLQKEVRQPLTDFENAEKDRVAKHEEKLAELIGSGECAQREWQNLTVEFMAGKLKEIQSMEYDWQEFIGRARVAVVTSITQIKEAIQKRQTADAEKVELERLRADAARREQEEREARIAQAAKEEAERKAEIVRQEALVAAETERLRVEAEKFEAEARAKAAEELHRLAEEEAVREREQAAERERLAEEQRVAAEEKARKDAAEAAERLEAEKRQREQEAIAAEERLQAEKVRAEAQRKADSERAANLAKVAEEERQKAIEDERERAALAARDAAAAAEASRIAAVEAERHRAEDARKAEAEETAKRERNKAHAAKINGEVRDALMKATGDLPDPQLALSFGQSTAIIAAIAKGLIPHCKINY